MGEFVEANSEELEWVEQIVEDGDIPEDDDGNRVGAATMMVVRWSAVGSIRDWPDEDEPVGARV